MEWKNWPAWLKGIIFGFILGLIMYSLGRLFIGMIVSLFIGITLIICCFLIGLIIDKKSAPISSYTIATISFLIPWFFFIIAVIIVVLIWIFSGEGMIGILIIPLAGITLFISLICILVGLKLNYKKPEKAAFAKMAEERAKPNKAKAIVALLLNILLPGLGSIIGGRKQIGILQLILLLVIYPVTTSLALFFNFPLMGIISSLLITAIWIWGVVIGVQIIKESTVR